MTHPWHCATVPAERMAKNRNPFHGGPPEPPPPPSDAAQRIVDLELSGAVKDAELAKLRGVAEKHWRMHWVDDAAGVRHKVRAESPHAAVEAVGAGARFRGYIN